MMSAVAIMGAEEAPSVYVQIKHVGAEDQPIPSLIITADTALAKFFKEDLLNRVYVLNQASFLQVSSFFQTEAKNGNWPAPSSAKVGEYGRFEVSCRTRSGTISSLCFVTPRKASLDIFKKFARYLSEQKGDGELLKGINAVILRIEL